ncbi:hypothetical protein ACQPW3_25540 [Actinosynnema sp. CA-248983]
MATVLIATLTTIATGLAGAAVGALLEPGTDVPVSNAGTSAEAPPNR